MKTVNLTIAASVVVWALTASSAFAKIESAIDPLADFNFNIGAEEVIVPDDIDIQLASRICANDQDKHVCLGERLQQAIQR